MLLLLPGFCSAQTVVMSAAGLGCAPSAPPSLRPPASKEQFEAVTVAWVGANELQVEAWETQEPDTRIDPGSATVRIDNGILYLSYLQRSVPGEQHLACASPTRLTFVVSGVPRHRYEVRVLGKRSIAVEG